MPGIHLSHTKRFRRYDAAGSGITGSMDTPGRGVLRNISEGGASFLLDTLPEVRSLCRIELQADGTCLSLQGLVVWARDLGETLPGDEENRRMFSVGIVFSNLSQGGARSRLVSLLKKHGS